MLSTNQVLQAGRYRIVGQFGQTESGLTYRAFDNLLNTNVIIKETVFDASAQPVVAKQLEGLVSIKHESFMQVHGYFSEVDRQFLVTESVEGENLQTLLEMTKRPFLLFDVLNWTEQIIDALIYLHTQAPPITHRGISPSNLTLIKGNKIKLLNSPFNLTFGERQNISSSSLRLPYSSLELIWDTLDLASQKAILHNYDEASAEILESPIDERSDVYALGATIYYLLTGRVPVDALERSIDLLDGKDDPLINPSKVNLQIPRNVSAFLLKSLEIKRENRFKSASALRLALQPMLELMKKIERETQKPLVEPQVRQAALHEVELAREALRKQREVEKLENSQESGAQTFGEVPKFSSAPISQGAFLEELEKAKQNLQQQNEAERIQRVPIERFETAVAQPVATVQSQFPAVEKVEKPMIEKSVLVAAAPVQTVLPDPQKSAGSYQTIVDDETELFASAQPAGGRSWLIPAVLVLVVLAVGGFFGFKFLSSGQPADSNPAAIKQNAASDQADRQTPTSMPVNSESPAPVMSPEPTRPADPTPTIATQSVPPVTPADDRSKVKKVTAPTPEKKAAPAAKSPTPKKKVLTVDDIIN